jgi:hypothetical protein
MRVISVVFTANLEAMTRSIGELDISNVGAYWSDQSVIFRQDFGS